MEPLKAPPKFGTDVTVNLDEATQLLGYIPASAEGMDILARMIARRTLRRRYSLPAVYRCVRSRMRSLHELRKFMKQHFTKQGTLLMIPLERLRCLHQQYSSCPSTPSRLVNMPDDKVTQEVAQARKWLFAVLEYHSDLFKREHEMRMFRLAIEKEMRGRSEEWNELERLYMVLTAPTLSSAEEQLKAAFALVLHLNFAEQLHEVSQRIVTLSVKTRCVASVNADVVDIREGIFNKAQNVEVDHFACAVPLSEIKKKHASIIDDNAGCCPICYRSYTDFLSFSICELLSDYPVRIKYCGHIVGKACLEQWMDTPKIAEARYPYRTCPVCRVQIEDEELPKLPRRLLQHLRKDRRAIDTIRELVYGWGLEPSECLEVATRVMSEDIAVEELLSEIVKQELELSEPGKFADQADFLDEKDDDLQREKFVCGFRGVRLWKRIRDEWMNSGIRRKE